MKKGEQHSSYPIRSAVRAVLCPLELRFNLPSSFYCVTFSLLLYTSLGSFFFIGTIPVRTQQQQPLTFSMRARCSYCIRQTSLPATSPIPRSEETTDGYPVWERRRCTSIVHEGCWRHTQINLGWGSSGTRGLTAWQSAYSCWRKVHWTKSSILLSGECNQ